MQELQTPFTQFKQLFGQQVTLVNVYPVLHLEHFPSMHVLQLVAQQNPLANT